MTPVWRPDPASLAAARERALEAVGELEVVLVPDSRVWDGRFANNAWLQELPDPLSKLTWDNAVLLAPATAAALGVRHGDVVKLSLAGEVEAPVMVMPGQVPGTAVLPLGGGRTAAGQVGDGVGFNPAALLPAAGHPPFGGLRVSATGRRHLLACTQDHHAIDRVGLREVVAGEKLVPVNHRSRTMLFDFCVQPIQMVGENLLWRPNRLATGANARM